MTRVRVNRGDIPGNGSITKVSSGVDYQSTGGHPFYEDRVEDVIGDGNDGHFFDVRKFSKNPSPCYLSTPGAWSNCDGFYTTAMRLEQHRSMIFLDIPNDAYIGTKTMAGTNPSRPVADIPVSLLELGREITTMGLQWARNCNDLRNSRELRPGNIAEQNLIIQFGLLPLISDVKAILEFSSHVDKRTAEIQKMVQQGGISKVYRKKMPFSGSNTTFDSSLSQNSTGNGPIIRTTCQVVGKQEAWGFAKWEPFGHSLPKDAAALRSLVARAIYGLTFDSSTLWEAMPWSWLIDYGSNIGSYFKAHRNIIPARCTQLYVCRHTTIDVDFGPGSRDNVVCPPWKAKTEYKTRRPVSFTSPQAHLPFLNGQQMSIIASLGVLSMR